ncbi:MAG: hypothetical protein ACREMN_00055 [Gemmatimonadales bacterium]
MPITDRSRHLYGAVALCAALVHVGVLWNGFALDDLYIVVRNPLVHSPDGIWRAFGEPYWPGNLTGTLYRPLAIATFAIDRLIGGAAWFHAVNVLWHVGVTLGVTVLARRWAGDGAALVAGLLFAVHPVHVEAVAAVVGRNELMAAAFTLLAVYAALVRDSPGWSVVALAAGIFSKENAAVTPALIAWGWMVGVAPLPPRRRLATYGATWAALAVAYGIIRWSVLHPYAGFQLAAPVFLDQGPVGMRLTAISALLDVARLLVFPLHLRADYSPLERTAVTSVLDARFLLTLAVLTAWAALVWLAWRRGRRLEAYGLGWIAIAFLPVSNLLFPTGIFVAERTLYLPSAGLTLAAGALLARLDQRRLAVVLSVLVLAGAARTILRVPVWRDNRSAVLAMIEDAPLSYRTWDYVGWELVWAGQTGRALTAFQRAGELYPRDARIYLAAAHMAYALERFAVADSLLDRADAVCDHCVTSYRNQASAARLRGDSVAVDSLLARAHRLAADEGP